MSVVSVMASNLRLSGSGMSEYVRVNILSQFHFKNFLASNSGRVEHREVENTKDYLLLCSQHFYIFGKSKLYRK